MLALEVEALLARRLQTQIYLKGLARTVKQARQLIVHGHIGIAGRKVTVPSYMVANAETPLIDYYMSSPMTSDLHPERPAADFAPQMTTVKEERRVAEEKERDMRRARELERIAAMRKAIAGETEDEEEGETVDEDKDITELTPDDLNGEKAKEPAEGEEAPKEAKDEEKEAKSDEAKEPKEAKEAPKDEKAKKGGDS